jgi:SAM-dependent MidA family methyltransferase
MPFCDFMNLCLYHPEHGYYAQTPDQVGKSGDFFTSVSCGPVFGILLAEKIAHWWQTSEVTGPWRILEPGANNAALALDILHHLRQHHPEAYRELQYITLDPLPVPRAFQQKALSAFAKQAECLDKPDSLLPLPTFVIANEVLDAFPCHLIELHDHCWQEIWIESTDNGSRLTETLRPVNQPLPSILTESAYPEGYRTELRAAPTAFLHDMQKTMSRGRMLFLDYGFAEPEYYDKQRIKGTLRTYQHHQASEDVLTSPGEVDITAHVEFTSLVKCASQLGMKVAGFMPQEFMLSRLVPELLARDLWKPSWQQNFQTLVHPAHLGGKFHALELSWREETADDIISIRRLAIENTAEAT